MDSICFIFGTRPEIIKMAPLIKEVIKQKMPFFIIHTGQHYSFEMDKLIFSDLELPVPKYNLEVGSGSHGLQTGKMLERIEEILVLEKPSAVLVQGDTNSVLAGALAAVKLHIKVGHVEAGLRSFDRTMPEELNRIIVDHISDLLFVPTNHNLKHLQNEGISNLKIHITGNTIVDSVLQNAQLAEKKSLILKKQKLIPNKYFLLTLHRAENVDDKSHFSEILDSIEKISEKYQYKIVWPLHPRTKTRLVSFDLWNKVSLNRNIAIIEPVGFLDSLMLQKNASLVLTDSGGLQEESCILKVPCVTLRDNTERPESVEVGANFIAGAKSKLIIQGVRKMLKKKRNWQNPFGDGTSSKQIISFVSR